MKEEKYLELLKSGKVEDLKLKLEEEIRKNSALKTNSKSRYNALKRIEKRNSTRFNLQGYGIKDNKYYFTDSYMYAILNDNCNMEFNDRLPVESLYNIDSKMELEKLYISLEDLNYYIKTKENYKNDYFSNVIFDYKLLKDCLDIIGSKDIEIFTNQDKNMLVFINSKNEKTALLGAKVY